MGSNERTPLLSSGSTLAPSTPVAKPGVKSSPPGAPPHSPSSPTSPSSERMFRSRALKHSMSRTRLVIILAGIWSSNFAFALQSTAIPTLAPTIASDFKHAELASYLGSVFTLANTAGIPVYGVLMDALGRRFAMLTACAFYGVGSVCCALAPGMWWLIAGRGFSGLGGGGLLTVSAVICTDLVDLHERGFYQGTDVAFSLELITGLMMTIFGLGSALGGPTAGWLSDSYGWPLAFWSQLPVVIWCGSIVATFLPEPPIPPTHSSLLRGLMSLDWGGILLLVVSTASLVLGMSFHTSYFRPWSHPSVWGLLLASGVTAVLFVSNERGARRPIVPMSLFSTRQLCAIWATAFFVAVSAQGFLYQVPTYFAVLMDMPAAQAGWVLSVCSGVGLSTGTLFAGYHIRRGGRYTVIGVLSIIPTLASAFVAAAWKTTWPNWTYYATILPLSWGYAVFLCVSLIAVLSSVDSHAMPKATALLYTVRSLGATLGVSLGGSVQVGSLVRALRARFSDVPGGENIIDAVVHSKSAIKQLPHRYGAMALDAYAISLKTVWLAAGFVAIGGLVGALFIRQNVIHKGADEDERVE